MIFKNEGGKEPSMEEVRRKITGAVENVKKEREEEERQAREHSRRRLAEEGKEIEKILSAPLQERVRYVIPKIYDHFCLAMGYAPTRDVKDVEILGLRSLVQPIAQIESEKLAKGNSPLTDADLERFISTIEDHVESAFEGMKRALKEQGHVPRGRHGTIEEAWDSFRKGIRFALETYVVPTHTKEEE